MNAGAVVATSRRRRSIVSVDMVSSRRGWARVSMARVVPAILATAVSVRLVIPDLAVLDAAVAGDAALARSLGCDVAEDWAVFGRSVQRARDAVAEDAASARWGTRLFVVDDPPTLVGWGGFKGPPDDATVELGYAVAPAWRGRGVASDAVGAMLREAWTAAAVRTVLAHTLAERNASVRVLEKAGFVRDGERLDAEVGPLWRWRRDRANVEGPGPP
jgi:RimJ/RimL family protein N-acetyltransferase